MKNNKKIVFDLPEEVTVIEVVEEILKNNNLEESDEDFFNKDTKGIEPRLIIVRDAALTIFKKKISEKKLIEILAKHLETSKETAEKVVQEIKEKLIPYAKVIDIKEEEEVVRKPVETSADREKMSIGVKKIEITDVEKNAERIQKTKKFAETSKDVITEEEVKKIGGDKFSQEKKGPDDYREPIEQE